MKIPLQIGRFKVTLLSVGGSALLVIGALIACHRGELTGLPSIVSTSPSARPVFKAAPSARSTSALLLYPAARLYGRTPHAIRSEPSQGTPLLSRAELKSDGLRRADDDPPFEEQLGALHPASRVSLVAAKLDTAARQSAEAAIGEAIRFCDEDPAYSLEYGRALISTLARQGDYRAALRFVLAEDAEGWLGENGSKWLTSLFSTWAKVAPRQALQTVEGIVPPGQRAEAFQAVAAVWAQSDPLALVEFVRQLPATTERDQLLQTTLLTWYNAEG